MIIYASYGNGHYQVSKAIEAVFQNKGVSDILLLDLMAQAHPLINKLTQFAYIHSFNSCSNVYGWIYNITKGMDSEAPLLRMLHSFGKNTLLETISNFKPDLVIHTFPQLTLPQLVRKSGISIPLISIVTDFDLHGRWLHPEIHRYYVATEDLRQEMTERGISKDRVITSGIPIKPIFSRMQQNSWKCHNSLHANKKIILLMAGAYGVMKGNYDICQALLSCNQYQIIVVCGHNKALFRQLEKHYRHYANIQLYEYVQDIASIMKQSHCMITKPGGITISEAIECRLPLILYRPVPGQELNNARYLEQKGVASIVYNTHSLLLKLQSIFEDDAKLEEILMKIDNLRKPEAAEVIVDDIMNHYFIQSQHSILCEANQFS